MLLGDRVREIAESKGISFNEIARRCSFDRRYLNKIIGNEIGETSVFKAQELAAALGVTLDRLMEGVKPGSDNLPATGTDGPGN